MTKIPRLAIVEELRNLANEIRSGKKTMEDFWTYQSEHINDSTYQFLSDIHPGLNVVGWRVIMAIIDPFTYGRDIKRAAGTNAPISKRS